MQVSSGLLFTITSIVDFVLLATSIWLGLYILTRNPKRRISWLASGILWALGGAFLNSLVYLHAPPKSGFLPWWWGWDVTIAVVFWFHLSISLFARALGRKWRWNVILVYFLMLNFIAMQTYTNLVYGDEAIDLPLSHHVLQPGALYPLYGLFLVFILVLSLVNLLKLRRMSRVALLKEQFFTLLVANCIAILGIGYEFLSTGYGLNTPIWPGDLCLGLGGILLGYGILQINALHEGKVVGRDFLFSFIATGLVVAAYLMAAFFSRVTLGFPFVAFILLAITSHSLVDWGRERLERFIYRSLSHPELRQELREFSRTAASDRDLEERLGKLLKSLCQTLEIERGLIGLRDVDEFIIAVSLNGDDLGSCLCADFLAKGDIQVFELQSDAPENRQASAVVPLVAGGEQLGVIILGHRTPSRIYSEDDLLILDVFADTVAGVIYGIHLQEEKLQEIQSLMEDMQERERYLQSRMREVLDTDDLHSFLQLKDESEAISAVEDALRHLNDFAYLGDHPLANLKVIGESLPVEGKLMITHRDHAKALHRLLVTCIEKLKPMSSMPAPPSKEWHQYVILHECYVEETLNRDVLGMLYIGEGTFNRARRRAVRAVTRALAEMERNTLEEFWSG
jgi:hypothetical protein